MPQGVPGTPSGTYGFISSFTNAEVMFEAFGRCGIRASALTQHHMADARRSLNLELQTWVNKGINLFQVEQNVIQLTPGVATYIIAPEIVSLTDVYYNVIANLSTGPGFDEPAYDPSQPTVSSDPSVTINSTFDRWLRPMGRDYYARIPNKTAPGIPVNYWFNRIGPPAPTTITFWQPPSQGYPQVAVTYFGVRMAQDANLENGETPDVVSRALDALCAALARRLARKYAPNLLGTPGSGGLIDEASGAWLIWQGEDTEKAEVTLAPALSHYWRL